MVSLKLLDKDMGVHVFWQWFGLASKKAFLSLQRCNRPFVWDDIAFAERE